MDLKPPSDGTKLHFQAINGHNGPGFMRGGRAIDPHGTRETIYPWCMVTSFTLIEEREEEVQVTKEPALTLGNIMAISAEVRME
jgi:hypothetical protein